MALTKFSLADLAKLDGGRVALALDRQLAAAIADCQDRPAVDKVRAVVLTVELHPCIDPRGDLANINVAFEIRGKCPVLRSRNYTMDHRLSRDTASGKNVPHLVFNQDDLTDPINPTLPFDGDAPTQS